MKEFVAFYLSFFEQSPVLYTIVALLLIMLFSIILHIIFKQVLLRVVRKLLQYTGISDVGYELLNRVATRLANIAPALAYTSAYKWIPHLPPEIGIFLHHTAACFIILSMAMALAGGLDIVNALYNRRENASHRPIRGYIQLLKLAIYLIAGILIVSVVFDKSPILLLSGLGAMAAVLMLVFQDTILSLVASIQISANGTVRVGDWIEMPSLNTDGTVIDLALHTVKVQNLDRSVTTFPVRRLITDPFKNWRGMQESGGRRVKRAIYINQASIHFLTESEFQSMKQLRLMKSWLASYEKRHGEQTADETDAEGYYNSHRLTNVSVFRAYVEQYLYSHPEIDKTDTILVRQMDPEPTGMPIEIYCFVTTTDWNRYEELQADIIDHIYAILPLFGLSIYQQPSGQDMEKIGLRAASLDKILNG